MKRYLDILYLAAKESETAVDNALRILIDNSMDICKDKVHTLIHGNEPAFTVTDMEITEVDLSSYDNLLEEVLSC